MRLTAFISLLSIFNTPIVAVNLYVASYAGDLTTLSLTTSPNNSYSLTEVASTTDCGPNPTWLTIDTNRGLLFCLNEGLTSPNGSLSSFTISSNGSLTHIQNTTTISGPVAGVIYGDAADQRGIALAHYTGSALTTYSLGGGGRFTPNQQFPFTLNATGPNPARQEASHVHEAITDPTGMYILAPDLGADLVRVYSWTSGSLDLMQMAPLQAAKGSGPRHAAFWTPNGLNCGPEGCLTTMYLVAELAGTITSYGVTYLPNGGGLSFEVLQVQSTHGYGLQPPGTAPAEVLVTPDNRFVMVSNRNDSSFVLPSPFNEDSSNNATTYFPQFTYASVNSSDTIPAMEMSDSVSTFEIQADGTLSFVQLAPAGGLYPRRKDFLSAIRFGC